jgi:UDP-4-amino-4-deoxy-L-arabinose-oxoglutarate aminotransferase
MSASNSSLPPIPFSRPTIEEEEIAEVVDTLRSGWITSGPKVRQFEEMFKQRLGVPHALAFTSATAGLHILLTALGIGPGDEVIVPTMTWASTANIVELVGARAVLADVDPLTLQIDPLAVERLISPRTKAVIPVHYAGEPSNLDAIRQLIAERNIVLIEDAAHGLGTAYKGKEIGSDSFAAIFSFHPIKNITTGEGGVIVCHDSDLAKRLSLLRFHGIDRDAWKRYASNAGPQYDVVEPGYKYNLTDIQAALGIHQLAKLDRFNVRREYLAEQYNLLLKDIPGVVPLGRVSYPAKHAWHLYIVRFDAEESGISRDRVIQMMGQENISLGLHFHPLHLQAYYQSKYNYRPEDLPHASKAGAEIVSLPLYPLLSEAEQVRIVDTLSKVLDHLRASENHLSIAV